MTNVPSMTLPPALMSAELAGRWVEQQNLVRTW